MLRPNFQKGFALLFTTILTVSIGLVITGSVAFLTLSSQNLMRTAQNSSQALFAAESGLEDATYRIHNLLPVPASYNLQVGQSTAEISVATQGTARTVQVQGAQQNATRNLELVLDISSSDVQFYYGVQVGSLGLTMGNGSTVQGNVFSNGNIIGNDKDQSTITGDAFAAGSSDIKDIKVQGNAKADELEDCIIQGTASYFSEIEDCTAGAQEQLTGQLEPQSFPISQAQIDAWKAEAEAGGTLNSYSTGNNAQVTLGPKKINGSASFGNTNTVTLEGAVWITGAMSMGNTATLQLSSGYGSKSGVLIVDGPVSFGNGAVLRGSGNPASKLMIISLYTSTAFNLGNTGTGDIFYAPNGSVSVGNTFSTEEVTAKGLTVGNGATITYESGLANMQFSSGPGAGFVVTSWKEIE